MKARLIEDQLYEVVDGRKWYTASRRPDGSYFVMNHVGRAISEGSDIQRRVVRAVQAVRMTEPGCRSHAASSGHRRHPNE